MSLNWTNLCYQMNKGKFTKESDIEDKFSQILDMVFGWHEFEGKLKRQVPVKVGHETKFADIVLYSDGKPLVIEMKGPGFKPGEAEADQLKSYMKILGSEYGIIANDAEMILFYSPFSKSRIESYCVTKFDKESADGNAIAEIITCDEFSLDKMEAFRLQKQKEAEEARKADELAQKLCDTEFGRRVIAEALAGYDEINADYSSEIISKAVNLIKISKAGHTTPPKPQPTIKTEPVKPKPPVEKHGYSTAFTGFIKKGLAVGTEIQFKDDHSFVATVSGDKEVIFEGKAYSLSGLAHVLHTRIGDVTKSGTYQGGNEFVYNGVVLLKLPDVK